MALGGARERGPNYPVLAIVTGTKPDFYKQAPLVTEAMKRRIPSFVIDTGQHFDTTLGYGIQEFNIQESVACNLQVRGNLMEKASELLLKFAMFGKIFKEKFPGLYVTSSCPWRYPCGRYHTSVLALWTWAKSCPKRGWPSLHEPQIREKANIE